MSALIWFLGFGIVIMGGMIFLIFELMKVKAFLAFDPKTGEYIGKHTRNDMIFFALKTWGVMFIISFFSFSILWFATLLIWMYFGFIFFRFIQLWKYRGYSPAVLLSSTVIILILSFVISSPIRNIIGSIVLK